MTLLYAGEVHARHLQTIYNLSVKTHTFNKAQSRPGGPTAKGDPIYQKK